MWYDSYSVSNTKASLWKLLGEEKSNPAHHEYGCFIENIADYEVELVELKCVENAKRNFFVHVICYNSEKDEKIMFLLL